MQSLHNSLMKSTVSCAGPPAVALAYLVLRRQRALAAVSSLPAAEPAPVRQLWRPAAAGLRAAAGAAAAAAHLPASQPGLRLRRRPAAALRVARAAAARAAAGALGFAAWPS